jgi:hypothetical protein
VKRQDEHARLQGRTDELKRDHAALALDVTPFNKVDHDKHTADLQQHHRDLDSTNTERTRRTNSPRRIVVGGERPTTSDGRPSILILAFPYGTFAVTLKKAGEVSSMPILRRLELEVCKALEVFKPEF